MSEEIGRRRLLQLSLGAATVGGLAGAGLVGAAPAMAPAAPRPPSGHAFRLAMRFWFEFDNATQFHKPKEMDDAWAAMGTYFATEDPPPRPMWDRFREMHRSPDYPGNFIAYMKPIRQPLEVLSGI